VLSCIDKRRNNTRADQLRNRRRSGSSRRRAVRLSRSHALLFEDLRGLNGSWNRLDAVYRESSQTIKLGLGSILTRWVRPAGSILNLIGHVSRMERELSSEKPASGDGFVPCCRPRRKLATDLWPVMQDRGIEVSTVRPG
jgi:hypothetical protein